MYATNFFETKILNTFNNIACVGASSLYIALFLSNPTETGAAGTEVNYTGYTRPRITFTVPYPEGGGIGIKNDSDILWNKSPIDVGEVKYIGIYDNATVGAGNMWLYGALSVPLNIKANHQPSVYVGDILYYTLGNFSTPFKTKMLNALRGQNITGFTPYFALFNGDPESGGAELAGGSYARVKITFSSPTEQASGQMQIQNTAAVKFANPTSVWGTWAYDGIRDAASGGELILKTPNPSPEVLQKNYIPYINIGDYKVMMN